MANQDKPCGLKPHGQVLRLRPYTSGSACYPGDAVKLASDGQVDPATTGELLGVCMSYASGANVTVMVCDDPNQLFEVQADTAIATTDVGLNCTLQGSANTTYKRSGQEIQASTIATTDSLSLQILGISTEVNNSANANDNDVIVRINAHQLSRAGKTGV
jgi:hypothetical protein